MRERQQGSTAHPITFLMVSSTDHIAGVTGLTPTVTISKDGGSFAAPAGAVSEVGNGWYVLAGNATDRNTLGGLLVHATAAGADPMDVQYTVVGYDPFDAARLGLTALPATGTLAVKPAVTLAAADVTGSLPAAVASIAANAITTTAFNSSGVTIPDARLGHLDADISTRLAGSGYTAPPTAAQNAAAVWDEPKSSHTTTGTFGVNLDAAVSTRLATSGYTAAPAASTVAAAVRDVPNASPSNGSLGAAVNAAAAIGSVDGGTVSASPPPTTTTFTVTGSSLTGPAGSYVGMRWMWQTGVLPNGRSEYLISGHTVNGSAHAFTVAAMSVAPPAGDTGIIR